MSFVSTLALVFFIALPALAQPEPAAVPLQPDANQQLLLGRPIVAIDIDAPGDEDPQALLALLDLQPGYVLAVADVQAAIERLYALGRFAQVQAFVTPLQGSVLLRFLLSPILRLEEPRIRGLKRMAEAPLLRALGVHAGDEWDSQTAQLLQKRALSHASQAGFPLAQVHISQRETNDKTKVAYLFDVIEGPPVRIASVALRGTPHVPQKLLLHALISRTGGILNQESLQEDRRALLERLVHHGFVRAQVRIDTVTHDADGAHVCFFVEANERLFFHFSGNRLFDDAELMALWPSNVEGTPQTLLGLFAQRVRALYGKQSYTQMRIRTLLEPARKKRSTEHLSPVQQPSLHSAHLYVQIHEHAPVWIRKILIEGASLLPQELLRQQVSGTLARELAAPSFFTPLGPAWAAQQSGAQQGLPRVAAHVPAEQRWVAELYEQAGSDIANALRELGFVDAEVEAPTWRPTDDTSDVLPRWHAWPDQSEASAYRRDTRPSEAPIEAEALFHVHEGKQHFIDSISIAGNQAVTASEILARMAQATGNDPLTAPVAVGTPLSASGVEDARIAIVRMLRDLGYLYAKVSAQVDPVATAPLRHNLSILLDEGPRVRVQHILVRGNRYTREAIIRSRVRLRRGQPYRLEQAIEDQQEVMALGTFSRARVKLVDEEHQSEQKDVVVEVQERPRQPIEVVPGLSTALGPRLKASYTHLNVLGTASTFVASLKLNRQIFFGLFGRYADNLRQRYAAWHGLDQLTHALEREVRLGLRSPPIRALPFDPLLRLDVVDQRINAVRYGLDATTVTLGSDFKVSRRLSASVEVQGGITELECPLGDNCKATAGELRRLRGGRPIQQGLRHTIKFGPWLRYEGRNDPISPSRGFLLTGRVTQAFGQARPEERTVGFAFTKYEGQATTYVPLWGAVLALSARGGTIHIARSKVPIDERFFMGGRDSLRGFVEGTLIPQDACIVENDSNLPPRCAEGIPTDPGEAPVSLGGNSFALLKFELRLPVQDNLSFDLFADVGNLWVDLSRTSKLAVRVGTGVGLRYATPVGAMTLDFGLNPSRRAINGEAPWQVHFSIGSF